LESHSQLNPLVPDLRTDWLTGRSVIVAENRALRPNEFSSTAAAPVGAQSVANLMLAEAGLPDAPGVPTCPFCVGNESRTPPALHELFDAAGRWQVRVVPNMFPAVATGGPPVVPSAPELTSSAPAHGAHEVIIESARHIDRMSALSPAELKQALVAYAHRLQFWRDDGRFKYGLIFKNQGHRAGASIAHLHSQFIALPAIPSAVEAEMHRAAEDYRKCQSCAYCRLIERERSCAERIVLDRNGFVAFCPFASLQPCEIWLLPDCHEHSFEALRSTEAIAHLADVLHWLLERLELTVPDAAYNMLLRTAPWGAGGDKWLHWRIELLPRFNAFAGFELATGIYINPLSPEVAARQLRSP
jgi:UDPglucose--hexose-1-phosphate uridylyltransferase